jgi:hypothetical protein
MKKSILIFSILALFFLTGCTQVNVTTGIATDCVGEGDILCDGTNAYQCQVGLAGYYVTRATGYDADCGAEMPGEEELPEPEETEEADGLKGLQVNKETTESSGPTDADFLDAHRARFDELQTAFIVLGDSVEDKIQVEYYNGEMTEEEFIKALHGVATGVEDVHDEAMKLSVKVNALRSSTDDTTVMVGADDLKNELADLLDEMSTYLEKLEEALAKLEGRVVSLEHSGYTISSDESEVTYEIGITNGADDDIKDVLLVCDLYAFLGKTTLYDEKVTGDHFDTIVSGATKYGYCTFELNDLRIQIVSGDVLTMNVDALINYIDGEGYSTDLGEGYQEDWDVPSELSSFLP